MSWGSSPFIDATSRRASMATGGSNATHCSAACTPASVRPAARAPIASPWKSTPSAFSTTSWIAVPFGWRCHPAYAVPSQARLMRQAWDGPVPEESGEAAMRTLLGLFLDLFFLFLFHLALAELLLVEILVEVEVGVLVRL